MIETISGSQSLWTTQVPLRIGENDPGREKNNPPTSPDKPTESGQPSELFVGPLAIDHAFDPEALIAQSTTSDPNLNNAQNTPHFESLGLSNPMTSPSPAGAPAGETGETTPQRTDKPSETELSEEEQQEVQKLQQRDREVRSHEQAHIAAGGQYVRGGAKFDYESGPNGQQYAVGGEVSIDTSKSSTPEATLQKAQVIQRAALAPANPSPQDRTVAAKAAAMASAARREVLAQQQDSQESAKEVSEQKEAAAPKPSDLPNDQHQKTSAQQGLSPRRSADTSRTGGIDSIVVRARASQAKQTYGLTQNSPSPKNPLTPDSSRGPSPVMGSISSLDTQL